MCSDIWRYPYPAFHDDARAAAHDGLGDGPLAVHELRLRADAQRPRRVSEPHRGAFAAAGRTLDGRNVDQYPGTAWEDPR